MKDFVNEFLQNYIMKPSVQVIKKIMTNSDILKREVFDSEIDAQMYPLPQLQYKVCKILLEVAPVAFYAENRGLLNNTVSILVA